MHSFQRLSTFDQNATPRTNARAGHYGGGCGQAKRAGTSDGEHLTFLMFFALSKPFFSTSNCCFEGEFQHEFIGRVLSLRTRRVLLLKRSTNNIRCVGRIMRQVVVVGSL